jgi:hypothetical protein
MSRKQFPKLSPTDLLTKAGIGIYLAVLLASSATPPVLAEESAGNDLPTVQIFNKVKDTYASMITYSDEGWAVISPGENSVINFSTRLARTNFYRVEWEWSKEARASAMSGRSQAVWSSGAGDYLQAEAGVQAQGDRKIALAHASAYSGGVTKTVPQVFFNLQWEEEPIDDLFNRVTRQADESVGNVSCYVFSRGAMGATNMLWIGKQDFLIHQTRLIANVESMPAFNATETHTNIVLNRGFSPLDFVPPFPLCQSSQN